MNYPSDSRVKPVDYQPPQSSEELLQRYSMGERYFVEADIPDGADLSNVCLEGANLSSAYLTDVDFRGANLRFVNFEKSNIKCSDFRDANLEGAVFKEALIDAAVFDGANLKNTNFAEAYYYGVQLKQGQNP